ncbi:hypothetical protein P4V86_03730 [Brevibacillus laterosporus]|uniref:hypothetical protein n=1 Tax=Brevibacillus laterosporus TaxID=1465 RepID=UPI000361ACD1|nr:hypothetical protein [Brevibacillus laterosporus]ATO48626.1 hypothetical protein BrL25_05540 [Brevibacillus laterosporus DSM 25]MED2002469.1 hypothetical protein [Brevibacillus laterosporus]
MHSLDIISKYKRNGIVIFSALKPRNYPLYLYLKSNLGHLAPSLAEQGVEVLDDSKTLRSYEKIRMFLRYHYGEIVDLSEVRQVYRTVYNYLLELGSPKEVVEGMGFKVQYKSRTIDIEKDLRKLRADDGSFPPLPQSIYNKVYYRAKKQGVDVKHYLKSLGT